MALPPESSTWAMGACMACIWTAHVCNDRLPGPHTPARLVKEVLDVQSNLGKSQAAALQALILSKADHWAVDPDSGIKHLRSRGGQFDQRDGSQRNCKLSNGMPPNVKRFSANSR